MVNNSILLTDSSINKTTGGGVVSLNLLEVLQEISDVKLILSGQHFPDGKYDDKITSYCIRPEQFGYSDPFFGDVFAKSLIEHSNLPSVELALSYGCPWGQSFEYLRKETFSKLIADLAPHDVSLSREEHLKLSGSYSYPHLNNDFLFKKMYLKHLQLADLVIVHSRISANYIEKEAELKERPIILPHGTYIPDNIPALPDKFAPCYMGSLGADKGIIYLFRAIINSRPEITLLIGGKEAQNFNVEDKYRNRFTIYGPVGNLYDFYKNTSVGVFPSVTEGFGICGLECLANGRPIITTPGTGVSELIQDGREGFVVPIRDSDAIKEKLEWFAENPSEIRKMGKNAQQLASKFDWKNIKKQYNDVIEKLL